MSQTTTTIHFERIKCLHCGVILDSRYMNTLECETYKECGCSNAAFIDVSYTRIEEEQKQDSQTRAGEFQYGARDLEWVYLLFYQDDTMNWHNNIYFQNKHACAKFARQRQLQQQAITIAVDSSSMTEEEEDDSEHTTIEGMISSLSMHDR